LRKLRRGSEGFVVVVVVFIVVVFVGDVDVAVAVAIDGAADVVVVDEAVPISVRCCLFASLPPLDLKFASI